MEEKMNVSLKFFDDALVQRVIDFTELSDDKKTKENINALCEEIKNLYNSRKQEYEQKFKEHEEEIKDKIEDIKDLIDKWQNEDNNK